jgi:hypothetical protein
VFSQGLDKVIGQVLPLARTAKGDQWQSGRWYLRDEHCRLVPGIRRWAIACRSARSPG